MRVPQPTDIKDVPTWRDPYHQYHYHYTTVEAAFNHILPSHKLRLSPYATMRDPLETKAWEFVFAPGESAIVRRALPLFVQLQHKNTYILSLGGDVGPLVSDRGYGRARMWEQYGDRGQGACLCFRHGLLKPSMVHAFPDLLKAGPVTYQPGGFNTTTGRYLKNFDLGPVLAPFLAPGYSVDQALLAPRVDDLKLADGVSADHVRQVIGTHITDRWLTHQDIHLSSLLLCKDSDWEAEHEYRYAVLNLAPPGTGPDYLYAPYRDSLQAVILGHLCPEKDVRFALDICRRHGNVELRQISWDTGFPVPIALHLPGI
ncbi:MAG: hypothetical protein JWQ18_3872 [Conexibacter sp.]|nr:hypothetical protein [Conexibacter sp.]